MRETCGRSSHTLCHLQTPNRKNSVFTTQLCGHNRCPFCDGIPTWFCLQPTPVFSFFWSSAHVYGHKTVWALLSCSAPEIILNLALTSRMQRSETFKDSMHPKWELGKKWKRGFLRQTEERFPPHVSM